MLFFPHTYSIVFWMANKVRRLNLLHSSMYYQAEDSRKGGYYFGERLRVEDPKIKFRSNQPSRSPSICRPVPRRTPHRRNDSSSSCYWEWPEISLEQENGTTHPTYKVAFYARLETIEVSPLLCTTYQWDRKNSDVATDFKFEFFDEQWFREKFYSTCVLWSCSRVVVLY